MSMTILQGLKKVKHIDRKIEKAQIRIRKWCSYIEPDDLPAQYDIKPLIQSVNDLLNERMQIRHALHTVNALHKIEYKGRVMTVDELLIMRINTIPVKIQTQKLLRRKEKSYYEDKIKHEVVLQYNPHERDKIVDSLEYELDEIDSLLDEINISVDIFKYL